MRVMCPLRLRRNESVTVNLRTPYLHGGEGGREGGGVGVGGGREGTSPSPSSCALRTCTRGESRG